jgi:dTDP-4-dehydrorhamnose 3,5-epimerase-like enzyme
VLRGLHFQVKHPQAEIVTVIHGGFSTSLSICVRIRRASATGTVLN